MLPGTKAWDALHRALGSEVHAALDVDPLYRTPTACLALKQTPLHAPDADNRHSPPVQGEEDSDVYFSVIGEIGAVLGEAFVNLEQMFAAGKDLARESLKVLGADNKVCQQ